MAGPNPYRLYSFEELRHFGKSWLVCEECRRFAPLAGDLKGRDTRTTTFSCSVCGGEAKHVFEDPAKDGKLQFDPRPKPRHHTDAVVRLTVAARLRQLGDGHRHKVPREDLPQAAWKQIQPREPQRHYVLKRFPVQTFGDIAAWGLQAQIGCRRCHRGSVPLEIGENLKPMPLLGTRWRCTKVILGNALGPDRVCRGLGRLLLSPGGGVPDAPFIGVCCYNAAHTGLEVGYLVVNAPPWQAERPSGDELFACPGCGRAMQHSWSTVDTTPQNRW